MTGIDVWSASLDRPREEVREFWTLLDEKEKAHAKRFHRDVDRSRYIAGRGTLRTIIGSYTSNQPESVALVVLPGGKPALTHPRGDKPLHFNLSHCGGLALFAFSDSEVGIDVQRIDDIDDNASIVKHFFSRDEGRLFHQLKQEERTQFFYRTWVRKEACLKATGEGFAVDLSTLSVGCSRDSSRLLYKPGKTGVAESYQIVDLVEFGGHAAAIAFATDGTSPEIHFRQVSSFQPGRQAVAFNVKPTLEVGRRD